MTKGYNYGMNEKKGSSLSLKMKINLIILGNGDKPDFNSYEKIRFACMNLYILLKNRSSQRPERNGLSKIFT